METISKVKLDRPLEDELQLVDFSTVNIYGGYVDDVDAAGSSVLNIYGGEVYGPDASDASMMNIFGGILDLIQAGRSSGTHTSIITVYGTNFNYPYGEISKSSGSLTGILANGDAIDASFWVHDAASIVLAVPEPGTIALLLAGGLCLVACAFRQPRRRSRKAVRCFLLCLLTVVAFGASQAKAEVVIDYDTTIDCEIREDVTIPVQGPENNACGKTHIAPFP